MDAIKNVGLNSAERGINSPQLAELPESMPSNTSPR